MDERTINADVTMRGGDAGVLGSIDQYEIVRELGEGGFGSVYLARDTVGGVEVAIKGLPPEVKHNRAEMENVKANFALVSRLHHPYIAAALHLHPAKAVSYVNETVRDRLRVLPGDALLVMEYAPGVTLDRWRKQFPNGVVPLEIAANIAWQVAQALDFAEQLHAVHRRHPQVRHDDVHVFRADDLQRGVSVARRLHLILVRFQQALQQQQNPRFIID